MLLCYIYILSVQFVVVLVYSLTWICVHVCERDLSCVVCEPTSMNVHPAHMIEPFLGGREMFVRARASHMCNVCVTMFVRARASRIWAHTHIHIYIYTIHTHTHTHTHSGSGMGPGASTASGQLPHGHTSALRSGAMLSYNQSADRHLYRRPVP